MKIDLYDAIEFSKIYKRVLNIELSLKIKFIKSLKSTFEEKAFYRLIPFLPNFKNLYPKNSKIKSSDKLNKLIKDTQKTELQKVVEVVRTAYLSDILSILTNYKLLYKNKKFINFMYCQKMPLNDLKQHSSKLCKLRNSIMHFDINYYKNNKADLILTLNMWEQIIECNNYFLHKLPKTKVKTATILKMLYLHFPAFLNINDRIVCDIFDDVAFINGCEVRDLPKYWTIIRSFYKLKSKYKNN